MTSSGELTVNLYEHAAEFGAVSVVHPVGELDGYTVGEFRSRWNDLAPTPWVVVDLNDVPFMDSSGLGALIGGIRRSREAGGDVAVACKRATVVRLLHTTGFDRIVHVAETVPDAVASFGRSAQDYA